MKMNASETKRGRAAKKYKLGLPKASQPGVFIDQQVENWKKDVEIK